MAALLALVALVVVRHGGCAALPSGPPPGVPPFASGGAGVMVTCGGGTELLWLGRTIVLVSAVAAGALLALVFVQTVTGRRFLPLPVRPPLRPRLFALGVAVAAAGAGLLATDALVLSTAGRPPLSVPLLIAGALTMGCAQGPASHRGGRAGGLGA